MESRNKEEKNFFKFDLLFSPSHDGNFFLFRLFGFSFETSTYILSFREQTSQVSRNISFRARFAVFLSSFHFVFQGIIYLVAVVLGKEMREKEGVDFVELNNRDLFKCFTLLCLFTSGSEFWVGSGWEHHIIIVFSFALPLRASC